MPDSPTPWVGLVALAACGDCPLPGPRSSLYQGGRGRPDPSWSAAPVSGGLSGAAGLQTARETPNWFRGLVGVQCMRGNPTDWYRSAAWALM
jgi:hypothetical protein